MKETRHCSFSSNFLKHVHKACMHADDVCSHTLLKTFSLTDMFWPIFFFREFMFSKIINSDCLLKYLMVNSTQNQLLRYSSSSSSSSLKIHTECNITREREREKVKKVKGGKWGRKKERIRYSTRAKNNGWSSVRTIVLPELELFWLKFLHFALLVILTCNVSRARNEV